MPIKALKKSIVAITHAIFLALATEEIIRLIIESVRAARTIPDWVRVLGIVSSKTLINIRITATIAPNISAV